MTALVIGSGGYLGRHLMSQLRRSGVSPTGWSSGDGTGICPRSGLLPETHSIPSGTRCVFYLAQSPFHREGAANPAHLMAVNALSAVRAATLSCAARVDTFVYVSSGSVYAPSFAPQAEDAPLCRANWYALSKIQAEEALDLFRQHLRVVVVRPFTIYGPAQSGRLISKLIDTVSGNQSVVIQPSPGQPDDIDGLRMSLCFIEDAVRILVEAGSREVGDCINMASAEIVSIRQVASQIADLAGRTPRFEMSTTPRASDLVADVGRLTRAMDIRFTPLRDGLAKTMAGRSSVRSL